ncbi:hypothetical protein BX659_101155 [Orenia metallireducens]|jgi:thermostable 8-oxoguanine DNA glycosylase|uniref:Uncharacterized protein n=1 Tax=Orenia metallireducens TaxID=1413210 RepID=A0A285FVT8_9FIRM|nr:hypothetical protein [Orenia metallireducens]PRX35661.1 hypothetical protein BX659_101155 [Orenia metallireducens]SNY15432.1 hypothetical protein SAMN06265827_10335 [Orenia metallireducens]
MTPKINFQKYLKIYPETSGLYPEKLKDIGKRYHQKGYLSKDELYQLAHLNSTRSSYHVHRNPVGRVEKITEIAYKIDDEFAQVILFNSLKGVGTPTASAILTSLNDKEHCVIDTRVWATLYRMGYFDKEKEQFNPDDYLAIMKIVRELAQEEGMTTAEIGYALFAYDVVHREGNLH